MGIFSGISEGVVASILCGHFKKYAGPDCADLRLAIGQNIDLYQLWVDNARAEGIRGPREVRSWARMFPKVQNLMTPKNMSSGGSGSRGWGTSPARWRPPRAASSGWNGSWAASGPGCGVMRPL